MAWFKKNTAENSAVNVPPPPPAPPQKPAVQAAPVPESAAPSRPTEAAPKSPAKTAPPAAAPADQSADDAKAREAKARAALMRQAHLVFGEVVSLMMISEAHKRRPLEDLQTLVMPPVALGQCSFAETRVNDSGAMAPAGFVLWATVSPEVDRRLTENAAEFPKLAANEWRCGDIIWIIEAFGGARPVNGMLNQLIATTFKGKTVKYRSRDAAGTWSIKTVGENVAVPTTSTIQ